MHWEKFWHRPPGKSRISKFYFFRIKLLAILVCLFFFSSELLAQQKSQQPPPASVTLVKVTTGKVAPQSEFIATIYFQEISDTASEISGLAEVVRFEEGQQVKKKQVLVELGSEILRKRLQATILSYEQILSELEIARIDLKRREKLFNKQSISEQVYDENRFRVIGLEKRAAALNAQVEQLEIELEKKVIRSPFDGIVIKRNVDRGEWISEGEVVAVIGKDDIIDIVADVPERFIQYVKNGMKVSARANGKQLDGTVIAIVPKGDITTRTFPVKIRSPNHFTLYEGMSAKVTLPTGKQMSALIVPRDAVVTKFGQNIVYAAVNARAKQIAVKVIGYDGLNAGIESSDLAEGMLVAVEGNERLRDGQAVVSKQSDGRRSKTDTSAQKENN
jgi:RND family efflux transporter MFP subunit